MLKLSTWTVVSVLFSVDNTACPRDISFYCKKVYLSLTLRSLFLLSNIQFFF